MSHFFPGKVTHLGALSISISLMLTHVCDSDQYLQPDDITSLKISQHKYLSHNGTEAITVQTRHRQEIKDILQECGRIMNQLTGLYLRLV